MGVGDVEKIMEDFTPGEPWDMRVKIDIWPEAVWSQPWDDGTLAVEVEREAKDQSTRDKALEALRERYCDIEDAPADHVAKEGDVAMVDIDGYLRDEDGNRAGELPIQGAVGGDDLELILEPGKFLPGVVEALIGKKAGEKVTVPVDFPESRQYREEQPSAGKKKIKLLIRSTKSSRRPWPRDSPLPYRKPWWWNPRSSASPSCSRRCATPGPTTRR